MLDAPLIREKSGSLACFSARLGLLPLPNLGLNILEGFHVVLHLSSFPIVGLGFVVLRIPMCDDDRMPGASDHQSSGDRDDCHGQPPPASEGSAMKTIMLSALIVATGISLSGCAQPGAPGTHPDKLGDQGAPLRQADAGGGMGIDPARLERTAGSISARAMTWQNGCYGKTGFGPP